MATVIKKYKVVQTGANTQSGGFKLLFIKDEYHGSLYEIVAKLPIKEAEYVTTKIEKKIKIYFLA